LSFEYPDTWTPVVLDDPKAGIALRSPNYQTLYSGKVEYPGEMFISRISNPDNIPADELFWTFDDTSRFWFQEQEYERVSLSSRETIVFPDIVNQVSANRHRLYILIECDKYLMSVSYIYEGFGPYTDVARRVADSVICE
jgi:hypothetical protein